MADRYFDKDGRVLHSSNSTDVNHVSMAPRGSSIRSQTSQEAPSGPQGASNCPSTPPSFTSPFEEQDDASVNAVRFQNGQRRDGRGQLPKKSDSQNGNFSRGRGRQRGNTSRVGNSNSRNANAPSSSASSNSKVCSYHVRFGNQAQKCEQGCMLFEQHQRKAPNAKPTNPRM